MTLEQDPAGFYATWAERAAEVAAAAGAVSAGEQQAWLEALHVEQAAERFLAGRLHIFAWGVRPVPGAGSRPGASEVVSAPWRAS